MKRFRMKHTKPVLRPKGFPVPPENAPNHEVLGDLAASLPEDRRQLEMEEELNRSQPSHMKEVEHSIESHPGPSSAVEESNLSDFVELQDGSSPKDSEQISKSRSPDIGSNETENDQNQLELPEILESCVNQNREDYISNEAQSSTAPHDRAISISDIKGNVSSVSMDNQNVNISIKFPISLFKKISRAIVKKQKKPNVLESESGAGTSNQTLPKESCGFVTPEKTSQDSQTSNDSCEEQSSSDNDSLQVVPVRPEICMDTAQATVANRTTECTVSSEIFTETISLRASLSTVTPNKAFGKPEEVLPRLEAKGIEDFIPQNLLLENDETMSRDTTKVTEESVESAFKEKVVRENNENTPETEMVTHEKTASSSTEILTTHETAAEGCHRLEDESSSKASSSVISDHSPRYKMNKIYNTGEISHTCDDLETTISQNVSDNAESSDSNMWYGIVPLLNVENVHFREIRCDISTVSEKYFEVELSNECALIKITTNKDTDVSVEVVKIKKAKDASNIATENSSNEPEIIHTDISCIALIPEEVKIESIEPTIPDCQILSSELAGNEVIQEYSYEVIQQETLMSSPQDLSQNDTIQEILSTLEDAENNQMTSENLNEDIVVQKASNVLVMNEVIDQLSSKVTESKTAQKSNVGIIESEHINVSTEDESHKTYSDNKSFTDLKKVARETSNNHTLSSHGKGDETVRESKRDLEPSEVTPNTSLNLAQNEYRQNSVDTSQDNEITQISFDDLSEVSQVQDISKLQQDDNKHEYEQGKIDENSYKELEQNEYIQKSLTESHNSEIITESSRGLSMSQAEQETSSKREISQELPSEVLQTEIKKFPEQLLVRDVPQENVHDLEISGTEKESSTQQMKSETGGKSWQQMAQDHESSKSPRNSTALEVSGKPFNISEKEIPQKHSELLGRTEIKEIKAHTVGRELDQQTRVELSEREAVMEQLQDSAVNKYVTEISDFTIGESLQVSKELLVNKPTAEPSLSSEQLILTETALETLKELAATLAAAVTSPLSKEPVVEETIKDLSPQSKEIKEGENAVPSPLKEMAGKEPISEPSLQPKELAATFAAAVTSPLSKEPVVEETIKNLSPQSKEIKEGENAVLSPLKEMAGKEPISEPSLQPKELPVYEPTATPTLSSKELILSEATTEPILLPKSPTRREAAKNLSAPSMELENNEAITVSLPLKDLEVGAHILMKVTSSKEMVMKETIAELSPQSKDLEQNATMSQSKEMAGKEPIAEPSLRPKELEICETSAKSSQKLTLSEPTTEQSLILEQLEVDAPTVVTSPPSEKLKVNEPIVTSLPLKDLAVSEPIFESLSSEELTVSEPTVESLEKGLVGNEPISKTSALKTKRSVSKYTVSPSQEQELAVCERAIKPPLHSTEIPEEERDVDLPPEFDNEKIQKTMDDLTEGETIEDHSRTPHEPASKITEQPSKKLEKYETTLYEVADNKTEVDVSHYSPDNKSAKEYSLNLSPGEFASEPSSKFVMNKEVLEKSHELANKMSTETLDELSEDKIDVEKSESEKFEESESVKEPSNELTETGIAKESLLDQKESVTAAKSSRELQTMTESETALEKSDKKEELEVAIKVAKIDIKVESERPAGIFSNDSNGSEILRLDNTEFEHSSSADAYQQGKLSNSPNSKSTDSDDQVSEESFKKAEVSKETNITLKSSCTVIKIISTDDTVVAVNNSAQAVEEIGSEESQGRISPEGQLDENENVISQLNSEKSIELMKDSTCQEETSQKFSTASKLPDSLAEENKKILSDISTKRNEASPKDATFSSLQKSSEETKTHLEECSKHISHTDEYKSLESASANSDGESEVDCVTTTLEKISKEADSNQEKEEIVTISKQMVESKSEDSENVKTASSEEREIENDGLMDKHKLSDQIAKDVSAVSESTDEESSSQANVKSLPDDSAEGNKNILSDILTKRNETSPKYATVSSFQKSSGDPETHQEEYSKQISLSDDYKPLECASVDSDEKFEIASITTSLETEKKSKEADSNQEKEEIDTISEQIMESKSELENVKTASSEDREIENERLMDKHKLPDQVTKDVSAVSKSTVEEKSSPTSVKSNESGFIEESQNVLESKNSHESQKISRKTLRSDTPQTASRAKSPNISSTSTYSKLSSNISKDQKLNVSRETRKGRTAEQEKNTNRPQIADEIDSAPMARRLRTKNPPPPLSKEVIPENQLVTKELPKQVQKLTGQTGDASMESASPVKRALRSTGHSANLSTSVSESKATVPARRLSAESQKTSTISTDPDMRRMRAGTPDRKFKERVSAPVRSSPRKTSRSGTSQAESRAEPSSTPNTSSTRSNRNSSENKNTKVSSSAITSSSSASTRKTRRGAKE